MKKRLLASLLAFAFTGLGHAQNPIVTTESSGTFIRNDGQLKDTDGNPRPDLKYYGSFSGRQMYFAADKISHVWFKKGDTAITAPDTLGRMDMEFENSNTSAQIIAADQQQGYLNFFKEHIPNGVVNVPAYEKITYKDVYANTDVEAVKREGRIEYKVTFHPGANPSTFKLKFTGTTNLEIMPDGSLKAENHIGKAEFEKPTGEKKIGGQFVPVNVTLNKTGNDLISITIANYQANKEFVIRLGERKLPPVPIKPILKGKNHNVHWSTYYGGAVEDEGVKVKTNNAGDIYIAGNTSSSNFPVDAGVQMQPGGINSDAYVAKFDKFRTRSWATFYGGNGNDFANDLAIDEAGDVYFVGITLATNFPKEDVPGTTDYFQPAIGAVHDAYIVKLNSAGDQKLWATYFGGTNYQNAQSITLSANAIYIVGLTFNGQIPFPASSAGYIQTAPASADDEGFIARFNKTTFALEWSTYFGGAANDYITACTIDNSGNLIIAGLTQDTGTSGCTAVAGQFPLCNPGGNAYIAGNAGGTFDSFIAKFNSSNELLWSTMFGGSGTDVINSIATDANGSIFTAGYTTSINLYPYISAFDNYYQNYAGSTDGFLFKFLSTGERVWATTYGGSNSDEITDIATDSKGDIYFTGKTSSADFPKKTRGLSYNQAQLNQTGQTSYNDAFVVWLNADLKQLWSTYFGGQAEDRGFGISANINSNTLLVVGYTTSVQTQLFPLRNLPGNLDYYDGFHDGNLNGYKDSFFTDFTIGCNPCARLAGSSEENDETEILSQQNGFLSVYPNPSNSILYLQGAENAHVRMYNIFGELVFSGFSETDLTTIDVSHFAKGMYILQINNGVDFIHQKIITE